MYLYVAALVINIITSIELTTVNLKTTTVCNNTWLGRDLDYLWRTHVMPEHHAKSASAWVQIIRRKSTEMSGNFKARAGVIAQPELFDSGSARSSSSSTVTV